MRAGAVIAWWDGNTLAFGVVAGTEKQRLRVVLKGGKEERVASSRLAMEIEAPGEIPGPGVEQRHCAGRRVESIEAAVRAKAATLDVALLWEIVVEQGGESAIASEELAELAFDRRHGGDRAALLLALAVDGLHFVRRGEAWRPRAARTVEQLRWQRETEARRESEAAEFLDGLGRMARGEKPPEVSHETSRLYRDALETVAIHEAAAAPEASALALKALGAAGIRYDRPPEGAFRLLRGMGRFGSDDENLQVLRFNLRTEFPAPVVAAAARAAGRGFSSDDRVDLTDLEAFSIDSVRTREIDDLISLQRLPGGSYRLGIHIADPAAFVHPGDEVDAEALARSVSHYMPDLRLTMLPDSIAAEAASLLEGQARPALSLLVEIDALGEVLDYRFLRSIVRSRVRLDYEEADRTLGGAGGRFAETLAELAALAVERERRRAERGAVLLKGPEVEVHVGDAGRPVLERLSGESPSRRLVSESMVLAGELAARFCQEAELPAIYRRQSGPGALPEIPAGGATDPVLVRAVRRCLKRGAASLQPGKHYALGLDAYVQISSPLRRYQDLAVHRQIAARLGDAPPPYSTDDLQRIAASTDRAEADARRAERAADEYWVLKYLEGRIGQQVPALVLEIKPRPIVQLEETLWEQAMPGLGGVEPGQRIVLRIERVNPRANLLVLR